MFDGWGRKIDYIRISVTDRCNLRCVYCMPEGGGFATEPESVLKDGEILRLAEIFARLGIRRVKLTGGEPLVRPGVARLAAGLKELPGIREVTLTTNGVLLQEQAGDLLTAGIDGINVSLDTLNQEVYRQITGRDELWKVVRGLRRIVETGQIPVKVNCVPLGFPGQREEEVARLARDYPVHVRYIEMMPIGAGEAYAGVREEEMEKRLEKRYGIPKAFEGRLGNGPGRYLEFPGFCGKVGFISAMSHRFCGGCNRVRLTSRGFLQACLQYGKGADLGGLLRGGADDEAILEAAGNAVWEKPEGHHFVEKGAGQAARSMFQIGG